MAAEPSQEVTRRPIRVPGLAKIRDGLTPREWGRTGAMMLTIVGLNVLGWGMLAAAVGGHYHISKTEIFGAGTGILAYTLGMRRAFDADHIAAIDNTTRKLVNEGQRPLSVGFFFSLGHSSVVFLLAVLLNFGIRGLDDQVKNGSPYLQYTADIVGTLVSGVFLFLIAALNVVILASIIKMFREMAVQAVQADAVSPPDGPFDAVVERHLLWTLPDPGAALVAWREAAPTGRLVLIEGTWGKTSGIAALQAEARALVRRVRGAEPGHHGHYTDRVVSTLPHANGITPPTWSPWSRPAREVRPGSSGCTTWSGPRSKGAACSISYWEPTPGGL